MGLDQLGVALDGERERQHHRAVLHGVRRLDHAAVDLAERDGALGRLQQRLDAVDRARVTVAGRGRGEGVERELGE